MHTYSRMSLILLRRIPACFLKILKKVSWMEDKATHSCRASADGEIRTGRITCSDDFPRENLYSPRSAYLSFPQNALSLSFSSVLIFLKRVACSVFIDGTVGSIRHFRDLVLYQLSFGRHPHYLPQNAASL